MRVFEVPVPDSVDCFIDEIHAVGVGSVEEEAIEVKLGHIGH